MNTRFDIKSLLASNTNVDLDDSLNTKLALRRLGYYREPSYGMTPYPDSQLFEGLADLQRDNGLERTGEMRPGDDTEKAIRLALNDNRSTASGADEKEGRNTGKYIWRTQGDGKVRSEHAERDGKTFSWNDPPEGGHPGEAPNCRCWAEEVAKKDCSDEKFKRDEVLRRFFPVDGEVSRLRANVHNLKSRIEVDEADIDFYEEVNRVAQFGGVLTITPHPLGKFAGWVFVIGEKISQSVLIDLEASLAEKTVELSVLENKLAPLERQLKELEGEKNQAEAILQKCEEGNADHG